MFLCLRTEKRFPCDSILVIILHLSWLTANEPEAFSLARRCGLHAIPGKTYFAYMFGVDQAIFLFLLAAFLGVDPSL